jgi:hypothetical protein
MIEWRELEDFLIFGILQSAISIHKESSFFVQTSPVLGALYQHPINYTRRFLLRDKQITHVRLNGGMEL